MKKQISLPDPEISEERIIEILSHPQEVADAAGSLDYDIKNIAKELSQSCPIKDGLAELFGLCADPITQKIRQNLRI